MAPTERVTRPRPARTAPIRQWSTLFGQADEDRAAREGVEPAAGGDGASSLDEVLSRSVELGYRVVDDYMRQGQEAARRLRAGSYGAAALATDVQELVIRMARHASDFLEVGLELLDLAAGARGKPAAAGSADAPPSPGPDVAAAGQPARVRLAISSARETDVVIDLRPELMGGRLVVQALRAVDPTLPALTDVGLEPATSDAPVTLRVRVPDGHPPGSYSGVVVEESTGRPVGTVCVRIEESAGATHGRP
jgi:hypothetical protein